MIKCEQQTKITIETDGLQVSLTTADVELSKIMQQFKGLLVAVGYAPQTVDDCFAEDLTWFHGDTHGNI